MKIFVEFNDQQFVEGWASTPFSDGCAEMHVEDEDLFNKEYRHFFMNNQGELEYDPKEKVRGIKREKAEDFDELCQEKILAGFTCEVQGVPYHFSFDREAQANMQSSEQLLREGIIDTVKWTVSFEGEKKRIQLDRDELLLVQAAANAHREKLIDHYREKLLPALEKADSIDAVHAVKW